MLKVYPDYYKDFRCTADKCKHNCCIGWEIDIDEETADFYSQAECALSSRFIKDIDVTSPVPHFILSKDERCPFLNSRNLCDIITELSEKRLCTICREHPRFHNELPDRTESGLGMCCEEAARIILSKKEPVQLISEGTKASEDEIVNFRDEILRTLQNRDKSFEQRAEEVLLRFAAPLPHRDICRWADTFLGLERLCEDWTHMLTLVKKSDSNTSSADFDLYMAERETEFEQFCVYLVYRHLANAPDMYEAQLRAAFAVLSYFLTRIIAFCLWSQKGSFTLNDHIELCRMFSCEIEYSDENLYILLDELAENAY